MGDAPGDDSRGLRLRDYPAAIGDLETLMEPSVPDDPAFAIDGWMWCERCERVNRVGDIRIDKRGEGWSYFEWALVCPTRDCEGTRYDWHPWHPHELPRALHPEYPAEPQPGRRYPV